MTPPEGALLEQPITTDDPADERRAQDKELLVSSRKYATEIRWLSWWHLLSTVAVHLGLVAVACSSLPMAVRVLASVVSGLVLVRIFIMYHDLEHSAIFRGSFVPKWVLYFYGLMTLNPPSAWKRSHDHHHRNNSKMFGASIGSFPVMTTDAFRAASRKEQIAYLAARHPMTIAFGYLSIFLFGMSIRPLFINVRRNMDSLIALTMHFGIMAICFATIGWQSTILAFIVPIFIASGVGAYLFYAQHNYPSAKLSDRADWNYVDAALKSSSYLKMGPVMNWLTGNIGYHHVHHLNHQIPFYRLPQAMAEMEELQNPGVTTLRPRDLMRCLSLKFWDPNRDRFVTYKEFQQPV